VAHSFQDLRPEGIPKASKKESVSALIQARHFIPGDLTEKLYFAP